MSHGGRSERVAFLREAIAKIEAGQMPGAAFSRGPAGVAEGDGKAAQAPVASWTASAPSRLHDLEACLQRLRVEGRDQPGLDGALSRGGNQKTRLGGTGDDRACALDAALGGGLDRDGVHEIVAAAPADAWAACGFALALAARLAAAAPGGGGALLWVLEDFSAQETGAPYGPGLAAHGLDPDRLVLVRTGKPQEALWVIEEALRAKALAAVVGEIWSLKDYGLAASRRLLLAARASRTPCLLLQAGAAGKAALLSSAADTRFAVAARRSAAEAAAAGLPLPGHPAWSVRLAKAKGSLGFDRDRSFPLVWDPAERCLRDEPTLPISVHRPAVSGDRARPAPHDGRRAAGA